MLEMLALGSSMSAIMVDLMEKDIENVKADFEKFKAQYSKVSKLVAPWRKKFPMGPVKRLGAALKGGDQGKIMGAMKRLGKVCFDCHVSSMPQVTLRYHWKDFGGIKVNDPVSKKEVPFTDFKHFLDACFAGIMVDLGQGQIDNAKKQFEAFRARLMAFEEVCSDCHDSERKYYIGDALKPMVDKLGQALNAASPDPKAVGSLMQGIGMASCFKCHSVHAPAAIIRHQWGL